jgi:hypothetical protein
VWDFGESVYEGGDEVTVRTCVLDLVNKATHLIRFGST